MKLAECISIGNELVKLSQALGDEQLAEYHKICVSVLRLMVAIEKLALDDES